MIPLNNSASWSVLKQFTVFLQPSQLLDLNILATTKARLRTTRAECTIPNSGQSSREEIFSTCPSWQITRHKRWGRPTVVKLRWICGMWAVTQSSFNSIYWKGHSITFSLRCKRVVEAHNYDRVCAMPDSFPIPSHVNDPFSLIFLAGFFPLFLSTSNRNKNRQSTFPKQYFLYKILMTSVLSERMFVTM